MKSKPCFPFFVDLAGKDGLVVGGSVVALRKIRKLLPYGPRLTVCAPAICEEIREIPDLELREEAFVPSLLDKKAFVIAATNDRDVNAQISDLCKELRIPVNVVDDRELCTFIFPALVHSGSLSIGVCTGGASPTAAVYWKKKIQTMVPENFGELLDWLDEVRAAVKNVVPDEGARSRFNAALFAAVLDKGIPLNEEETEILLSECVGSESRGGQENA